MMWQILCLMSAVMISDRNIEKSCLNQSTANKNVAKIKVD